MTAARGELQPPEAAPREWPRVQASIALVAIPSAVTVSRLFVASTLRRWGALFVEPEMGIVAAELVGQSVYDTGPVSADWLASERINPITVHLAGFADHLLIEVTDAHPCVPAPPGRGTGPGVRRRCVDVLARAQGARPAPDGRVLWAELPIYGRTAPRVHKRLPRLGAATRALGSGRP